MVALASTVSGQASMVAVSYAAVGMTLNIAAHATATIGVSRAYGLKIRVSGKSRNSSRATILRHRSLAIAFNAGAYADKTFNTTLTSASGPGIRQIGEIQEQIRPQPTQYV